MEIKPYAYYEKFGTIVGHRLLVCVLTVLVFEIVVGLRDVETARRACEALTRAIGKATVGQWPMHATEEEMLDAYQAAVFLNDPTDDLPPGLVSNQVILHLKGYFAGQVLPIRFFNHE